MVSDIKRYWEDKLLAPRVVVIDKPGVIYNIVAKKYGVGESKKRVVWYFEDVIVDLQRRTLKEIGEKETSGLFYRIGKDAGTRYILLSNVAKGFPMSLIEEIIKYYFNVFCNVGFSVADNIYFNREGYPLILEGNNSIICRKTGNCSMFAGFASAILSSLMKENFDSEYVVPLASEGDCKIKLYKSSFPKHTPNIGWLKESNSYNLLNFENIHSSGSVSFKRLLEFKKIIMSPRGKYEFGSKTMIISEIGCLDLIGEHYKLINKEELFKRILIESSEKIADELFQEENAAEKLKSMVSLLEGLGWGIPSFKRSPEKIVCDILNPPISKYVPLYMVLTINGYLNSICKKKFRWSNLVSEFSVPKISLCYESC